LKCGGFFKIVTPVMKALPFLAALLCSAPLAGASELELLQSRCSEQERVIRQLEEENSRLKALMTSASSTPTTVAAPKTEAPEASVPPVATRYATVRGGDTLARIAKRHGTNPAALIQLNQLKNPSLIRPGDKLRLPGKPAEGPASKPADGGHVVAAGETFYSIARAHGISTDALQSANPAVKATALRPGQTLQLASPAASAEISAPAPAKVDAAKPTGDFLPPAPPQQVAAKPAVPAPVESPSQTVSSAPRINTVFITEETDFSAFAAAHGTSTAKLNALNGLNLNPSTVLAKGSELYVPAQP
jgi:LysM repeat protein